jgi:hypothetical protein
MHPVTCVEVGGAGMRTLTNSPAPHSTQPNQTHVALQLVAPLEPKPPARPPSPQADGQRRSGELKKTPSRALSGVYE